MTPENKTADRHSCEGRNPDWIPGQAWNDRQINKKQIKLIKTLQGKLKMPDDEYRLMLSEYWVNSCTRLSFSDAQAIIEKLEAQAVEKGVWTPYASRPLKYDNLGKRRGMASPKQLRKVEVMWKNVSFTHDPHKRELALRRFILRIAAVDDLTFLTSQGASKVITAIQNMKGKHPGSQHEPLRDRAYGGI